jgi:hypothetical protein
VELEEDRIKVGSLVKFKPSVAAQRYYGLGIVVRVRGGKIFVKWSKQPNCIPRGCRINSVEVVSASR